MPEKSDGFDVRTVGCSLEKLVPDPTHLRKIRAAVEATHKATILASELLNLHIRRLLDADDAADLSCCFDANWLIKAYYEVTEARGSPKPDPALLATRQQCMPPFSPPSRAGLKQCLLYDARNMATVAATTVWMHFQKRVLSHVRRVLALGEEEYKALSKEQRRRRKLELMQVAADVCRAPGSNMQSPPERREWVDRERARLGIDAAVGDWKGKPLLYHLKARPHRFLRCIRLMSAEREAAGRGSFSLFPVRRTNVPRHARFDQEALRCLLGVGRSDHAKEKAAESRKRKRGEAEAAPVPRVRRSKEEMEGENAALFAGIVDLRATGVQRRSRFDFAFTTDGVCARVQMRCKAKKAGPLASMPRRGLWAIDELKRVARAEEALVVGVDPGKRELVVCVNMEERMASPVRYTQKQRTRDMRAAQYMAKQQRDRPRAVAEAEAALAGFNSRASSLADFASYCAKRHESLEASLAYYSDLGHRRRRWQSAIREQKSEERLYRRIEGMRKPEDARPILLAYGSWGLVAGRAGAACNRGNPPCIGVGLMRKLARRFVVSPTPEAYTSKTCCRCHGPCGPWEEKEAEMGKKIRGLRRCTQRDCMLPLNRDKNGATNIGTNFLRLMGDQPTIRSMTDEDLAFHRASICMECD